MHARNKTCQGSFFSTRAMKLISGGLCFHKEKERPASQPSRFGQRLRKDGGGSKPLLLPQPKALAAHFPQTPPRGPARPGRPGPGRSHCARACRRHARSQAPSELAGVVSAASAAGAAAAASLQGSAGGFALPRPRWGSRGSRSRAGGARRRGHGTAPALVTAGSPAARALSASPAGGLALLLAGPGLLLPLLALLLAAAAAARIMSGRRCAGGGAACASAGAEAVEPAARELFEACRNGDVERVKRLVTPEKVNSRDTAGRKSTPLHFAAGKRRPRVAPRTPPPAGSGLAGRKPRSTALSPTFPRDSHRGHLALHPPPLGGS